MEENKLLKSNIQVFLDYSTTATGYAIGVGGTMMKTGWIKRKKSSNKSKEESAYNYTKRLADVILTEVLYLDTKDKTMAVVIEDNYMASNPRTGLMLSFHRGQLIALLNPDSYIEVLPSQWRKRLGYKGRMNKDQAKDKAKALLTTPYFPTPPEDECEAICIGFACNCPLFLNDGTGRTYLPYTEERLPI